MAISQSEITAIINLATALLPLIEQGAVTIYDDVKLLLDSAQSSSDATPEQLASVQALMSQSDAAQDAAFAAYEAAKPQGA
jgi:hypothetical protein